MELDRVLLWRGDHVTIQQLREDFARYLYLPRLRQSEILFRAIRDGLGLLTWSKDSFAYADSFDEVSGRYRGLRYGKIVNVSEDNCSVLLVRAEVALMQKESVCEGRGFLIPDSTSPAIASMLSRWIRLSTSRETSIPKIRIVCCSSAVTTERPIESSSVQLASKTDHLQG
jgi:hypothetical protein